MDADRDAGTDVSTELGEGVNASQDPFTPFMDAISDKESSILHLKPTHIFKNG